MLILRKTLILILGAITGLCLFGCSELILPKQVEVKGTIKLPIRAGSSNFGAILANEMNEAFSKNTQEHVVQDGKKRVYNVDYEGQVLQTFFINIPIETTENLNPTHFLETINKQLNDSSADPKQVGPNEMFYVDSASIINDIDIPYNIDIDLSNIARYAISIDFDTCDETCDEDGNAVSGIGINFYLWDIEDDLLEMEFSCPELNITGASKPLKKGANIFGNNSPLTLKPADTPELNMTMTLKWIPGADVPAGHPFTIHGEIRFFRIWTKAVIDLKKAIKTTSTSGEYVGIYPGEDSAFDLSGLKKYVGSGFSFDEFEAKIYVDGPFAQAINDLQPDLLMKALIRDGDNDTEYPLYNNLLFIDPEPLVLDDFIDDNEHYQGQELPFWDPVVDKKVNKETLSTIFQLKPNYLVFTYTMEMEGESYLTVYPTFEEDMAGEHSKITTMLMVMLPLSLTATGEDSWIGFPDMFDGDDLFGRKEAGDLFTGVEVDYLRLTIGFLGSFFEGGRLFFDENRMLFPEGILLGGKTITVNVDGEKFDIVRDNYPIRPDIRMEFEKESAITVPKRLGTASIKIELKGSVNLGELLELE